APPGAVRAPGTWSSPASGEVGARASTRHAVQVALGCLWLLDGLLQFQSYMYGHGFVSQVLEANATGQPSLIGGPIVTLAHLYASDQPVWNTLAAVTQCAIGLGLVAGGRAVRPALLASFAWGFSIWWFGEGFGLLFSGAPVSPLMGAPGAVLLYVLVGVLVWPTGGESDRSVAAGGLLGVRGGRIVWSALWLEACSLWLLDVNRAPNAIHDQLLGMASSAPPLLASWQRSVATVTQGHGEAVAVGLAVASLAIGAGVWRRGLRNAALASGALLALAYWVLGQSLGGPFWGGTATDVNSGPALVLLALALAVAPHGSTARRPAVRRSELVAAARGQIRFPARIVAAVPVAVFGVLLLAAPSLFSASGAAPQAPGAMAGMGAMSGMDMSATARSRPERSAGRCTASACPIPHASPGQLAVAGELGSALAALWVTPERGGVQARLELLNANMGPVADPVRIVGSSRRRACGPGCWTFTLVGPRSGFLSISTFQAGHRYALDLPVRWQHGESSLARRLLSAAVANMRSLAGVRIDETLTSGPPGQTEKISYRLDAPDRMTYSLGSGGRVVVIGHSQWSWEPGKGWQRSAYDGGSTFNTGSWYSWEQYDSSIQLLGEHFQDGHLTADLALMSPTAPVWFQLHIDASSGWVSRVGMVAGGHFMRDVYSKPARHTAILPPRASS
ncbi:MAG TPA: hypothetical protein VGH93_14860, partial [Solirubrobacteraceae bacterium]